MMHRPMLSKRADLLQPSATMAISSKAGAMRRAGIDVISLAAGEPDFNAPKHVLDAGIEAFRKGRTRYTPAAGMPELREAAARYISEHSGTEYGADEVIVTCGAKQGIYNALRLALDPGDKVLIPAPCWVTYPAQTTLCEGIPSIIAPNRDGSIDVDELTRQIPGSRVVVLCNPSNPSGQVLSREELVAIGAKAKQEGALIIADEIYSELVYGPQPYTSFLQACPDMRDQTVVIHGMSKSFAMTGLRIGFAAAPTDFSKKMSAFMSQTTSNPTSTSQWASLTALESSKEFMKAWLEAYEERRNHLVAGLRSIPGVQCRMPEGAFYVFPDVRELIERAGLEPGEDLPLASRLLEEAHVAVVPGTPFSAPGHIRMSYATSLEDIEKALDRFGTWVAKL